VWHGDTIKIDAGNLSDYLGKAPHDSDRFYESTPAGVVMGLAWTSMGGSTLYIESSRVSLTGEPKLTVTGAPRAAPCLPSPVSVHLPRRLRFPARRFAFLGAARPVRWALDWTVRACVCGFACALTAALPRMQGSSAM
jgi:Lon protease (S16) C-terminal proteolytic domain